MARISQKKKNLLRGQMGRETGSSFNEVMQVINPDPNQYEMAFLPGSDGKPREEPIAIKKKKQEAAKNPKTIQAQALKEGKKAAKKSKK
jgi:hypothetical protein